MHGPIKNQKSIIGNYYYYDSLGHRNHAYRTSCGEHYFTMKRALLLLLVAKTFRFTLSLQRVGSLPLQKLPVRSMARCSGSRPSSLHLKSPFQTSEHDSSKDNDSYMVVYGEQFLEVASFIFKAGLIGTMTGASVVLFKTAISSTQSLFYEGLAEILPRPSFYWPLAICETPSFLFACKALTNISFYRSHHWLCICFSFSILQWR